MAFLTLGLWPDHGGRQGPKPGPRSSLTGRPDGWQVSPWGKEQIALRGRPWETAELSEQAEGCLC